MQLACTASLGLALDAWHAHRGSPWEATRQALSGPPGLPARCSKLRATKRLGDRQPRYAKFLQGTLLFAGLLLLLWVPLLLFSSGAPTYTVPAVTAFSTNATLSTSDAASPPATRAGAVRRFRHLAAATAAAAGLAAEAGVAAAASAEFPAFDGGRRRQRQQWLPDDAGMPDELATYSAQQFQLLCTSAVSYRQAAALLATPMRTPRRSWLGPCELVAFAHVFGVEYDWLAGCRGLAGCLPV